MRRHLGVRRGTNYPRADLQSVRCENGHQRSLPFLVFSLPFLACSLPSLCFQRRSKRKRPAPSGACSSDHDMERLCLLSHKLPHTIYSSCRNSRGEFAKPIQLLRLPLQAARAVGLGTIAIRSGMWTTARQRHPIIAHTIVVADRTTQARTVASPTASSHTAPVRRRHHLFPDDYPSYRNALRPWFLNAARQHQPSASAAIIILTRSLWEILPVREGVCIQRTAHGQGKRTVSNASFAELKADCQCTHSWVSLCSRIG